AACVAGLAMRAHDPPARGDVPVEHLLHHGALIAAVGQAHAEALPVAARPFRLARQAQAADAGEERAVALGQRAADLNHLGEALQLLATDGRLDVGHAVVVADDRVRLEDHLARPVAHGVRHAHAVLPQQPALRVPAGVVGGDHAAVAGAHHLAGVNGEARDVAVRLAGLLPESLP